MSYILSLILSKSSMELMHISHSKNMGFPLWSLSLTEKPGCVCACSSLVRYVWFCENTLHKNIVKFAKCVLEVTRNQALKQHKTSCLVHSLLTDKRIALYSETAKTREEITASSFDAVIQHPSSRAEKLCHNLKVHFCNSKSITAWAESPNGGRHIVHINRTTKYTLQNG